MLIGLMEGDFNKYNNSPDKEDLKIKQTCKFSNQDNSYHPHLLYVHWTYDPKLQNKFLKI